MVSRCAATGRLPALVPFVPSPLAQEPRTMRLPVRTLHHGPECHGSRGASPPSSSSPRPTPASAATPRTVATARRVEVHLSGDVSQAPRRLGARPATDVLVGEPLEHDARLREGRHRATPRRSRSTTTRRSAPGSPATPPQASLAMPELRRSSRTRSVARRPARTSPGTPCRSATGSIGGRLRGRGLRRQRARHGQCVWHGGSQRSLRSGAAELAGLPHGQPARRPPWTPRTWPSTPTR